MVQKNIFSHNFNLSLENHHDSIGGIPLGSQVISGSNIMVG